MSGNVLGLLMEINGNANGAVEAFEKLAQSSGGSLQRVQAHMQETKGVAAEFTSFIKSHLIFSVDEFIRLGREALEAAKSAAEFGEEVANLSEATGMTARQVSGLEFALKQTGLSTDVLDRATRELARNLSPLASSGSEGGKALKALGVNAYDASGHMKPLHEMLLQIADRFHGMKDGTEKAAISAALFGTRIGSELIPFLDRGSQAILAMEKTARELGVTLSNDEAKHLRDMNEELKLMDARMEGVKLRISETILPEFVRLSNLLTVDTETWRIWGKNVEAIVFEVAGRFQQLVHVFTTQSWESTNSLLRRVNDLETQTLLIQQKKDDLLKVFEGEQNKGNGPAPSFDPVTKSVKTFTDALGPMLQRAQEGVRAFADSQQSDMRQIELAYQRQVDSATKAIEADRQLLARKKITLAQEKREEQEYTEFLASAIQLRDAKWNAEMDKVEARIQKISARIAEERQKAHEELARQLQQDMQGRFGQADLYGEQASGMNNVMAQSALAAIKAVPAFSQEALAAENLKNALQGLSPVLGQIAEQHQFATSMADKFSEAMGKNIAQAIVYGNSIGAAMEKALKATIESIAAKAIVQAIYSTALGFLLLAEFDYSGAVSAFEAAAVFGAVGGAAAAVGAAIPGGSRSGSRGAGAGGAYRGARESGSGESGGYQPGLMSSELSAGAAGARNRPSGSLTVAIMGNAEAGEWLATTLNTAVEQRGVQLTASRTTRPAYAQG